SRPLPELARPGVGSVEAAIAEHAAGLVTDRSVLQLGIGKVPEAVAARLGGHRDLGIHSGFLGEWAMELVESGAVTNAYKPIDRGVTVGGTLMGSRRLYRWAHDNAALAMRDVRHTHAADVLARFDTFVSVNGAIEVDLSGQVNAEVIGDRYVGAVGGQVDYVRAGAAAPRGWSVIALPAATARSGRSRIVPRLASAVVTTARSDVDVVVTEYGAAHLRGQPLAERARRMIAIAAPAFRDELSRAVHGS
ncbi:MAG: acetyl-CoA hydrolase/transferase family protein, partial [Nocardioidaceae bacterium]